jgi:myo-inositol-1(or 4)-monophosphatase
MTSPMMVPWLIHVLLLVQLLLSSDTVTAFIFVPTVPTAHKVISSCPTISAMVVSSSPFLLRRMPATPLAIQTHLLASTKQKDDIDSDTVPTELLEEVLRVAIEASKKAGEIILGNAGGAEVTQRKANSRDLLTLIDPLCEQTIKTTILNAFPNHAFLGEEDVPPGKDASAAAIDDKLKTSGDWLWIVDPIDGTTNFVHGMPLNMPSIAVAYKGEVVVGVINDPHRNELFTATKDGGSFLNGELIEVGEQNELGDAVVAMGSPPAEESLKMSLIGVQALMPKVRTIRMLGSAAIMLAWIANGRLTAYWEYDLRSVNYSIV